MMLAKNGANVAVNARKASAALKAVAREARKAGGEVLVAAGDVSDYEACDAIVARTRKAFGDVDILVNNAGIFGLKSLKDMVPEDWQTMFGVHVFGAFNMIRLVLPRMLERRRGVILNVASFVAFRPPGPGRSHYGAAKAALIGLTRSLGLEAAGKGVRVVGLAPGLTETEMVLQGIPNLERRVRSIPLGRIGKPEEMAHAVRFLIENDFITGETLTVSGGE